MSEFFFKKSENLGVNGMIKGENQIADLSRPFIF